MSERKYTYEQIVKALEIHSDKENPCVGLCPYSKTPYCGSDMARDALALINSQKAEVEEWKARANDWQNQYLKLIDENEIYQEHIDQDIIYTKAIRTEAIKELLERAEERVTYFEDECGAFMPFIDCRDLEAIAEELSEEDAG